MFEFTVPDGDWTYHGNGNYTFKDLVFTENSLKKAKAAIKEFWIDGTTFTMIFMAKGRQCI